MTDEAGEKKLQLPASCRKNAEKIFSTMDHYQTPSKRETSSSIGVKFILSFKTFLRSSLKIKIHCLALVKVTSVVKYGNGGLIQVAEWVGCGHEKKNLSLFLTFK